MRATIIDLDQDDTAAIMSAAGELAWARGLAPNGSARWYVRYQRSPSAFMITMLRHVPTCGQTIWSSSSTVR